MKTNIKGAILIAVAMLSFVMMVIAVGIITLNSSQSLTNRHQIERIKAEQVAKGAFWNNYMSRFLNDTNATLNAEILDNKKFSPKITSSSGGGPNGTDIDEITVDYNLPQ